MATASRFNRGYSGGLAAGSQAGGGFRNQLQSTFQQFQAEQAVQPSLTNQETTGSQNSGMPPPPPVPAAPALQAPPPSPPPASPMALPWETTGAGGFQAAPLPKLGETPKMTQKPALPWETTGAGGFQPAPLPTLGSSQPMKQQPPSPFGPAPLPFGGARERGGPVMPGRAYLVGESGAEMFVPQQPGMVIPNQALNLSPGAQAYLERQKAPSPERSPVSEGALNMGLQYFAAPGALPGSLVGDYKDPNNGSRITSNPANRRYSEMNYTNKAGPETMNSLANRAVRQVGRSANDINRIAEQQRRRGNPQAIMQLGMMEKNQQFVDAQNDKNFQQGMQMFGMQQQAQAARDQQSELQRQSMEEARRQWELQMYGLKTGEQAMRDERERAQQEAERQAAAAAGMETITDPSGRFMIPGIRTKGGEFRPMGGAYPTPQDRPAPTVQMQRIPGTNQYVPTYDGKPLPGQPIYTGEMVPGSYVRRSTQGQPAPIQMTPVQDNAMPKFYQDKDSGKMFYMVPNGQGGFTRKWVDANGDGIDDRTQRAGAGAAAAATPTPAATAISEALKRMRQ